MRGGDGPNLYHIQLTKTVRAVRETVFVREKKLQSDVIPTYRGKGSEM